MPIWAVSSILALLLVVGAGAIAVGATSSPAAEPRQSRGTFEYEPPPVKPTVVFIGDSFVGGSDMGGVGDSNWSLVASEALEWEGCKFGVGGSGWTRGANGWTFGARVDWALSMKPSLIVFANGVNDLKGDAEAIGPAASDTLSYLRSKDPDVPVVVVGPAPVQEFPALYAMNDGIRAAAEANGALFVDAVAGRWLADGDSVYIGSDGFHPTDDGHAYLASKFADSIAAAGIELEKIHRDDRMRCEPPNPGQVNADGTPVAEETEAPPAQG